MINEKRLRIIYPEEKLKEKLQEHTSDVIIWMLANNAICYWKDFIGKELKINPSTLSRWVKILYKSKDIFFEFSPEYKGKIYRITQKGRKKYNKLLIKLGLEPRIINQDKIDLLTDISRELDARFLDKLPLDNISATIRFKRYSLFFEYEKYAELFDNNKSFFCRTLLFLSLNHPEEYPECYSVEEFSQEFEFSQKKLYYYLERIVDESRFGVKFFQIKDKSGGTYFFHQHDKLNLMIKAIVNDYFERELLKALAGAKEPLKIEEYMIKGEDIINLANLICLEHRLFDNNLRTALIEFIIGHLKGLKLTEIPAPQLKKDIVHFEVKDVESTILSDILKKLTPLNLFKERMSKFDSKIKENKE